MKSIAQSIAKPIGVPIGALLNLKIPTDFVSSFNVDTISGELSWTDTNSGTAEYEVYSSTNGAAATLLATTAAGATSCIDTTCKQNASVVYSVKAKKGTKVGDAVSATALATPLCWKTDQSTLTAHVIQYLSIQAGKSVTVNYSDGTNQVCSGENLNITKNFASTGQYNVWLTGDINNIASLYHYSQIKTYGNISKWILPSNLFDIRLYQTAITGDVSNWVLPSSLSAIRIYLTSITGDVSGWTFPNSLTLLAMRNTAVTGDVSGWVFPSSLIGLYISDTSISGYIPQISNNTSGAMDYQVQSCNFSDSNAIVFRKAMTVFNVSNQNVAFSTANIDKLLKAIADWYQVNAPTANCTFTMNGANMGIPTGGASNVDLVRLVNYYTAAGRTATVIVRTS